MVVALARPLQIVHAQPMNQDQEFAARVLDLLAHCGLIQVQGLSVDAKAHVDGEWIARFGEVVAKHAIQYGQHGLALGC